MVAHAYVLFSIARVGLGHTVAEKLHAPSFFQGYLPLVLLCPSLAHSAYLYERFVDIGDIQLHVNLDGSKPVPSVAVFIEVRAKEPIPLLETDYHIIQELSGHPMLPLSAPCTQVIFGNGMDIRQERFQILKQDWEKERAMAVVIGTEPTPGNYLLPANAHLLLARTYTEMPYEAFFQSIRNRVGQDK